LGSTTAIVDQSGNVVQTYRYDSFGNIISQTGSLNQPYTYTGREYDSETGLFYYRARYYAPKIGRFLQEDPIWNTNLYGYCFNNPVNYFDPLGLYWEYSQSSGNLTYIDNNTGERTFIGQGYSGIGQGYNNPNMQNVKNVGPIPRGTYYYGDPLDKNNRMYKGSLTLPLTPNDETRKSILEMGRDPDSFLIHDDNPNKPPRTSSTGCIILRHRIRQQMADCNDKEIRVVK